MTLIYTLLALTALPVLGGVVRVLVKVLIALIGITVVMSIAVIVLLALASHGKLI